MRKITGITMLLITSMVAGMVLTGCEKSNDLHVDLYKYINFMDYPEGEDGDTANGTRPDDSAAAIVIEGDVSRYRGIIKDDKPYVEIDAIQRYVDDRFYWDSIEEYVMYTNATEIYTTNVGGTECRSEGSTEDLGYVISYVEEGKCYVSMEFVDKFADVDYEMFKANDTEPSRICLKYLSGEYAYINAKKNNKMRVNADLMSEIVIEILEGEQVSVLEDGEEWFKAQTKGGYVGYLQKKYYEGKTTEQIARENDFATYTHKTLDEKVKLVWHQVTNESANGYLDSLTSNMKGMNVISPTWITMSDTKGGIQSFCSESYVEEAHDMGLQVWVLADDFSADENGDKYVNTVLASTTTREKLEDNIIDEVLECNADGINIDYEYISLENGDNFLQFLREMSIKCEENDLYLSVDNYIPTDWSEYYDLEQQGRVADYVVVMSYDEHTAGSEKAGPVASLPFVKSSVEDTVALVGDASRVIMGVPFYTRVWTEVPEELAEEGDKIIQDSINGNYALKSQAVSMDTAKETYESAGVEPMWNDETGTNYVYIQGETGNTQIWLEDARSIQAKLDVANSNQVGGIGCWKIGLESVDIWDVLEKY